MSELNYVEIKPKHCTECGKDYTPIIHSDECPHNKVGVSEQDELLLTDEGIEEKLDNDWDGLDRFSLVQYVQEFILAKAKPIIEKQLRAELNAEIRIELGSKAFEKGKEQERERIYRILGKFRLPIGVWQALKGEK